MPETSIIIRTKNEEKWIGEVLHRLHNQTYKDFEIIIIDSGSHDKTLDIAKNYNVRIVEIPSESYTHPYALNTAMRAASCREYFCIISAHSLPINEHWLRVAVQDLERYPQAMGVYGSVLALPDGTLWDKIFYGFGYWKERVRFGSQNIKVIRHSGVGVMGSTNSLIRRGLWDQRQYNEKYAGGGEDGEWASYWFKEGYVAIKDLRFTVYHSHYLTFGGWLQQRYHWQTIDKPTEFSQHTFRSDGPYQK